MWISKLRLVLVYGWHNHRWVSSEDPFWGKCITKSLSEFLHPSSCRRKVPFFCNIFNVLRSRHVFPCHTLWDITQCLNPCRYAWALLAKSQYPFGLACVALITKKSLCIPTALQTGHKQHLAIFEVAIFEVVRLEHTFNWPGPPPDPIDHLWSLSGILISADCFNYRSVQIFQICAEDQMLQDLILHTRFCGTDFIFEHG